MPQEEGGIAGLELQTIDDILTRPTGVRYAPRICACDYSEFVQSDMQGQVAGLYLSCPLYPQDEEFLFAESS
jgi:hypothetical protein